MGAWRANILNRTENKQCFAALTRNDQGISTSARKADDIILLNHFESLLAHSYQFD